MKYHGNIAWNPNFIYIYIHLYEHTHNLHQNKHIIYTHRHTHTHMETWKPKRSNHNQKPRGRSKAAACKRHTKHSQSAGVCSICLSERLSQLTNSRPSSSRPKLAYSSSSSSSTSCISSSYSSPVRIFRNVNGEEVLTKSRSMLFFFQRRKQEDKNDGKIDDQIKRGFWSKLLPPRKKGLKHSRTTRERVITTVYWSSSLRTNLAR